MSPHIPTPPRPTPHVLPPTDEVVESTRTVDQMVRLLVRMIDVQRPGAAERGRILAEGGRALAERFQVPAEFIADLERAAYLHEIGLAAEARTETSNWLSPADVRSLIVANHLLGQVDALSPAAFLVAAIAENWDGSGFPDRLQRGQIPLRSRLLRVIIDYHVIREPEPGEKLTAEAATAAISLHSGTWYDPAVVAQFTSIALHDEKEGGAETGKWRVPVARLEPGMVLAEDLSTASGLKLVGSGATITAHIIDMVQQRDTVDPVIDAWVAPSTV